MFVMKKWMAMFLCLLFVTAVPAEADVLSDLDVAESAFGVDNSDKTASERVRILEEQLGIDDTGAAFSERLAGITAQLGISSETAAETEAVQQTERSDAAIEGPGYDSPEEAACAYLEAVKEGNLEKLLSTFAVESYCENFRIMDLIRRTNAFQYSMWSQYPIGPVENELMKQVDIDVRRSEIISAFRLQLLQFSIAKKTHKPLSERFSGSNDEEPTSDLELFSQGGLVQFEDGKAGVEQAEQLVLDLTDLPELSQISIDTFLYVEDLAEQYVSVPNLNNILRTAKTYGAEGYKPLAVQFSVEGMTGIVFIDTIKYNGRWYNCKLNGYSGTIAGVSLLSGGICIGYDDGILEELLSEKMINREMFRMALERWDEVTDSPEIIETLEDLTGKPYSEIEQNDIDEAMETALENDLKERDIRNQIEFMTKDEVIDFFSPTELWEE